MSRYQLTTRKKSNGEVSTCFTLSSMASRLSPAHLYDAIRLCGNIVVGSSIRMSPIDREFDQLFQRRRRREVDAREPPKLSQAKLVKELLPAEDQCQNAQH